MKNDNMSKVIRVIFLIGLLGALGSTQMVTARECEYGSAYAWFRTTGSTWENATAHPVLKRGEPFEIKIVITAKTELQLLYVKLHEVGVPVYAVVEGPTAMEQLLECRQMVFSSQCVMYRWKIQVRTNTTWVNGYAPLEIFVQFNKNDTDEMRINFDVITAFILNQQWEKNRCENSTVTRSSSEMKNNHLPLRTTGALVSTIVLVGISLLIRKQLK